MSGVIVRQFDLTPDGLTRFCHPRIHALGHRGPREVFVVDYELIQHDVDPASGVKLVPIEEIFLDDTSVLIGFGTPNTFTAVCTPGRGWEKLAAFMFYRQPAYVANTKARVQAGVFFELRGLPPEVRDAVRREMIATVGQRDISCARLNAAMLARAGFTFGNGRSLYSVVRPTKFASLLWRHGLYYHGTPVDIRIVAGGGTGIGDHFVGVWTKELWSACRFIEKQFRRGRPHAPAPTFEPREVGAARSFTGRLTTVGMNRTSYLGTKFAFLAGQHPVYTILLPGLEQIQELQEPLEPFPGPHRSLMTTLKKHTIMRREVVWLINKLRIKANEVFEGVPALAALGMLAPSKGADHDTAVLYNAVIIIDAEGRAEARITSLKNNDPRSHRRRWIRVANWFLAKHVIEAGYHPGTVYACELWAYRDEQGIVLCFNPNSGTYQPKEPRMQALRQYLQEFFGVRVQYFPL